VCQILVNNVKAIELRVFIVGYSEQGESIVLLIIDNGNNTVIYSAVIDCFEYNDINKSIEILSKYKVNKLNLLCWTHPDEDHSVGMMDIINGYCDSGTKILLPEGLNGDEGNIADFTDKIKGIIKNINTFNKARNYNVTRVNVAKNFYNLVDELSFKDGIIREAIPIEVFALSPFSSICSRREASKNKFTINDLSIALLFKIDEFRLFFAGDIEDQSIRLLRKVCLRPKFEVFKTPHHTSKSSTNMINHLDHNLMFTCSTVYKKGSVNLPVDEVVSDYLKHTDFFHCTGTKMEDNDSDYGVIEYVFDLYEKTSECILHGHAVEVLNEEEQ